MQSSENLAAGVAASDIQMLRTVFRSEGFRTPDVYADVVSNICGRAFGADELLAEQDELAARYLANPRNRSMTWAKGPLEARYDATIVESGMPEEYHNLIEAERLKEKELIPLTHGAIEKVSDIRQFAEKVGELNGYVLDRSKNSGRRMAKRFSHNGIMSYFSVDTSGRRGSLWSSTNMLFNISVDGGQTSFSILLFRIARGILYYTSAAPSSRRIVSEANPRAGQMTLVSDLLKVGVVGQIRFFDLLSTYLNTKVR